MFHLYDKIIGNVYLYLPYESVKLVLYDAFVDLDFNRISLPDESFTIQ